MQIVLGQGVPHPLLAAVLNSQCLSHEQTRVCVHTGLFKERDGGVGGREGERERDSKREREREKDRQRQAERQRQRHRETE